MNKNLLKLICLFSLATVATGCGETNNSSSLSNSSSISNVDNSSVSENNGSNISSSSNVNSSSSVSSTASSNVSSNISSSVDDISTPSTEEDQYIVDASKRVTVTFNVNLPITDNEVYVIGDFNNWGKFNTLNDSSYRVNEGKIVITNVEKDKEYSYMYVQKLNNAVYTYNFASHYVDSENNQVIGYTEDGQLISQYCVTQSDEVFRFTASDNFVVNNNVTSWNEPIYGDTVSIHNPDSPTEVPTSGYNLCVKEAGNDQVYYIPLENSGTMDGSGRAQYIAYEVTLKARTSFTIYDGNTNIGWAEDNLEQYGAYRNFIVNSTAGIVCLKEGTYDIYVKLQAGNDSIYICEAGEQGESVPMSGYGLKVYPASGDSYFVALTQVDEFDGFTQHFGDNVPLNVGDVFTLYDFNNQAEWVEDTLSPYGQYQKFEATSKGIKCNVSGTYDIYVKMKFEADEIYIGDENGA